MGQTQSPELDHQGEESVIQYPTDLTNPSRLDRCRFLYQQIRSQLGHDLWWLGLVVFIMTAVEADHYKLHPQAFSTFNIIFEVVSAYSCVGVSVGYPNKGYSFCGEWHTVSKLLLAAVSLQGRHCRLPVVVDITVLLRESRCWIENVTHQQKKNGDLEWARCSVIAPDTQAVSTNQLQKVPPSLFGVVQ
ncbi:hypothetical protein UA08_04999 [Talaromyces atroroseus]|uniref:Uncharacterized protein n=1 Tax=Talaromyces atroroseus TaxID=1441469 RepID=A0A225AJ05_TALAT|nr:hypothetical protein UA08_04999 [Talaromyces atroroseus]OKL59323.1 hypothetical protein UA08_04999 [Talaromyces atroroseus]